MNDSHAVKSKLGKALAAVATTELRSLERALSSREDRQHGVHMARKACRRLRELLSLLSVPHQQSHALDSELKQLAHGLASVRDAHIAARTARLLAATHSARVAPTVLQELEDRSQQLLVEALHDDPDWRRRRAQVSHLGKAFEQLPWDNATPGHTKKVLKHSTQRVKTAKRKALKQRSEPNYHRWRRRTRKLRYQLQLLRKARGVAKLSKHRTKRYEKRADKLRSITDRLGWRQDFQVFLQAIEQLPESAALAALRAVLKTKSADLSASMPPEPITHSARSFVARGITGR